MNHSVPRRRILSAAAVVATLVVTAAQPVAASSPVAAVNGRAFGYFADEVTLSGSGQADQGPTPLVALSPDASNSPSSAMSPSGSAQYGSVTLFSSGQIDVATAGTTGPSGSVASSTEVDNVNAFDIVTATQLNSSCSASADGLSGSTTVTSGTVNLDHGGDHSVSRAIPTTPAVNTIYNGHVHLSATSKDTFRVIVNEQTLNGGVLRVTAAHIIFLGPTITGHLYIGRSECGVFTTGLHRPDGRIGKGSGALVGNDIYNVDGANQTRQGSAARGSTITFTISIQNDGDQERFSVHATGTPRSGYRVRYFQGSTEITRAVQAGIYQTPVLPPGGTYAITTKVKVLSNAAAGSSVSRLVTIASLGDGTKLDAVRFVGKRS